MSARPGVRSWVSACLSAVAVSLLAIGSIAASAGAQVSPTQIVNGARVNTRRPIDFHAAVFPETVYVGQQATYQVAVFLTENARMRLRRNPEFIPPELRGLLAYELGRPNPVAPRSYGGVSYEAVVFQRAMFPVKPGPLAIPSPQLSYALPQSSSYFSREERHLVHAESAQLVVQALPVEGRSDAFTGAVGAWTMIARIDTSNARVGDPLVLTLRVQGVGNVKLLPRPLVEIPWASVVPGPERVQVDSSGALVRGAKEFDWILTPTRAGRAVLPALQYEHFNPYQRKYAVATSVPIEVPVAAGALVATEAGEQTALMPMRTPTRPSVLERLRLDAPPSRVMLLILALLAPLPALVQLVGRRRPRYARATARSAKADPLAALATASREAAGDTGAHARSTRRILHHAIAERLGVTPQQLVSRRQTARLLRRRGVTREGTARVIAALDELDVRGFASGAADATTDDALARDAWLVVDREAVQGGDPLPRRREARDLLGVLIAVSLPALLTVAGSLHAQDAVVDRGALTDSASRAILRAEAGIAYRQRQFQDAAQRFATLAATDPRNADLLTDWGTVAWAAGDTVSTVIAWQRAARLDPLAVDLQERLSLLPAGARSGIAEVPMVPVAALTLLAISTWVLGWLALAVSLRASRGDGARAASSWLAPAIAWTCLTVSLAAGGAAWWGTRALDARELAVVLRPETMHVAGGSDSDAMGGVSTGDIVRRLDAQGAWQRVLHSDGRRGWLPASRLADLLPHDAGASAGAVGGDSAGVSSVPLRP